MADAKTASSIAVILWQFNDTFLLGSRFQLSILTKENLLLVVQTILLLFSARLNNSKQQPTTQGDAPASQVAVAGRFNSFISNGSSNT